jgi:DNA-binding beta-propeller fold protein YncE
MIQSCSAPFRRVGSALLWFGLAHGAVRGQAETPLKVLPRFQMVLAGEGCAFTVPGGTPCIWRVLEPGGGAVSPAGAYTAPEVASVRTFHIRAAREAEPGVWAEASVLVLPREPFGATAGARGGGWPPVLSIRLPFLDLATEQRFGDRPQVQFWVPAGSGQATPRQTVGFGLPLVLRWSPRPEAAGTLLTYREGPVWVRRDITGLGSAVLHPRDKITSCALETLVPAKDGPGSYLSHFREIPVSVRGLLPLAGDPAEAGQVDGQGRSARFSEPYGMAMVGCGQFASRQCLVADRAAHVVRTLSSKGEVTTSWGRPGAAGYADGLGCARFNGPTFLAGTPCGQTSGAWEPFAGFVVADSGNQVIRRVDGRGRVETLAGTPGQAGFRDGDPRQARFDDPQGLAVGPGGEVYVADRGNHVIRVIARDGRVSTLAGGPGLKGSMDGFGPAARFAALRGLVLAWDYALYAVDGHAVRRITLDGEVTTVLGVPDRPGFRDEGSAGTPCLDTPCGLAAAGEGLFIADQGNHAIREFNLATGALKTLAGDPALGETRFGLLRDGMPGTPGEAYAALEAPRSIAVCELGELYVSTGPCLVQLCRQHLPAAPLEPARLVLESRAVKQGAPVAVRWTAPAPEGSPLLYTLDFLHADGSLASRQQGMAAGGREMRGEGRFTWPGPGRVVLQWVTGQGISQGAEESVQVE